MRPLPGIPWIVLATAALALGSCSRGSPGPSRQITLRSPGSAASGPIALEAAADSVHIRFGAAIRQRIFSGYRIVDEGQEKGGQFRFEKAALVEPDRRVRLDFTSPTPLSLSLDVVAAPRGLIVTGHVRNTSGRAVRIRQIDVLGLVGAWNPEPRSLVALLDSGSNVESGVWRLTQPALSSFITVVHDPAHARALLLGFLTADHADDWLIHEVQSEVLVALVAQCRDPGVAGPGSRIDLDPLVVSWGSDPLPLLEGYAGEVAARHDLPLPAEPLAGFLTWYAFRTDIDPARLLRAAGETSRLLAGYPQPMRKVFLIDHGWSPGPGIGVWDRADARRFPDGLAAVHARLNELGFEMGLWSAPFLVTANNPAFSDRRALVCTDGGSPLALDLEIWPGQEAQRCYILDASLPASREALARDLAAMSSWGTSLFKIDFLRIRAGESGLGPPSPATLRAAAWGAMREGLAPGALVLAATASTNFNVGKANLMTVAADVGEAGTWPAGIDAYRSYLSTLAANWYKHRTFWVNDNQSVQVANGSSSGEARVRATAVFFSGAGFWLGEDPDGIPVDRLAMAARGLPVYGLAARPVDLFRSVRPEGVPHVWALPVSSAWGGARNTVAVFNPGRETLTEVLDAAVLGMKPDEEYGCVEWWTSRWLGRHRGSLTVTVPPFDVAVLQVVKVADHPWPIGTDLHYTPDFVLTEASWDPATATLAGQIVTKPGLDGIVYGVLPDGFRATTAPGSRLTVEGAFWKIPVHTTGPVTRFQVRFGTAATAATSEP